MACIVTPKSLCCKVHYRMRATGISNTIDAFVVPVICLLLDCKWGVTWQMLISVRHSRSESTHVGQGHTESTGFVCSVHHNVLLSRLIGNINLMKNQNITWTHTCFNVNRQWPLRIISLNSTKYMSCFRVPSRMANIVEDGTAGVIVTRDLMESRWSIFRRLKLNFLGSWKCHMRSEPWKIKRKRNPRLRKSLTRRLLWNRDVRKIYSKFLAAGAVVVGEQSWRDWLG